MGLQSQNWFNPSKGEEVLWYSHPSFIMNLPQFLLGVVIALAGIIGAVYIYVFQDWPVEFAYAALLCLPVGIGFTAWKMLIFKNTWYVITNRRVLRKTDIVGRSSSSKPHREVVRVDIEVSTFDAVVSRLSSEDIGDIIVRTADDSGEKFMLSRVPEIGLAESYLERLTGTGPDTSSNYDVEGNNRLDHEIPPEQEQRNPPNQRNQHSNPQSHDQQYPNQHAQNAHEQGNQHPPDSGQPPRSNPPESESSDQTPENPSGTDIDDDFDQFEPSDKA